MTQHRTPRPPDEYLAEQRMAATMGKMQEEINNLRCLIGKLSGIVEELLSPYSENSDVSELETRAKAAVAEAEKEQP